MKVISLRCPECGATLRAQQNAATVRCDYCNSEALVRQRTGVMQRPMPLPQRPQGAPHMAIATQKHSSGWVIGVIAMIGCAGALVPFIVAKARTEPAAVQALKRAQWDGVQGAALADVNGDGAPDIVARLSIIQPEQVSLIGAFDGSTGAALWTSETLGERTTAYQAPLAIAHGAVLVGDGGAGLRAFDASDGSTMWNIRLNEKVDALCAGDEGHVIARTADEKGHPVAVADGALREATPMKKSACVPLPSDNPRDEARTDVIVYKWSNDHREKVVRDKIDGMTADAAIHHRASGRTIALGHKKPGSRVGMIASYTLPEGPAASDEELRERGRAAKTRQERMAAMRARQALREWQRNWRPEVHWKATVPAGDPLAVREGEPDPEDVSMNGDYVVVLYETETTHVFRLTAIRAADGTRAWDIPVPTSTPASAVLTTPTHAMVSRWGMLYAVDIATGAHTYTID